MQHFRNFLNYSERVTSDTNFGAKCYITAPFFFVSETENHTRFPIPQWIRDSDRSAELPR